MSAQFKFLRSIRLINVMETLGNDRQTLICFVLSVSQRILWKAAAFFPFSSEMFQALVFFEGMSGVLQVLQTELMEEWQCWNPSFPGVGVLGFAMKMRGKNDGWSTERTEKHWEGGTGEVQGGWHRDIWKDFGETTHEVSCDFLTLSCLGWFCCIGDCKFSLKMCSTRRRAQFWEQSVCCSHEWQQ